MSRNPILNSRYEIARSLTMILCTGFLLGPAFLFGLAVSNDSTISTEVESQVWQFGYIPQKSEVSRVFYIRNKGNEPLNVTRIKPGCACTSISEIVEPILPGDSASITITFRTGRYKSNIQKTTRVFTDGSEEPTHLLVIKANVIKKGEPAGELRLGPITLELDYDADDPESSSTVLSVTNEKSEDLKVSTLTWPHEVISKVDLPENITANSVGSITVHYSIDDHPENTSGLSATFAFMGSDTTIVTVPIEIKR